MERAGLVLDLEDQRLPGRASHEGRLEVVVVRLDLDRSPAPAVDRAVIGVRDPTGRRAVPPGRRAPGCAAIFRGALPTGIVAVTLPVARSTTDTSLEPSLATYAVRPSPLAATQCGVLPTATTLLTARVAGSTTASSPGPWLTTRLAPPSGVNSAKWGEAPTGTWPTSWRVAGSSIRTASDPATVRASHLPSGLTSSARGVRSRGMRPISVPPARSRTTSAIAPCC